MSTFLLKIFSFLLLISMSLFASQKEANNIAQLSAVSLYNINKSALESTINSYIKNNKRLKALIIIEDLSKETYISIYKKDEKVIKSENLPDEIKKYKKYTSKSIFNNEKVGEIYAYFDESKSQKLNKKEILWVKNNPVIKIAVINNYPPYDFFNDKNNLVGFHTDIKNLMNKNLGTNIKLVPSDSWKDAYSQVIEGKVNAIFGLSWTKQREKDYFIYNHPYHFTPYPLIVKKSNNDIHTLDNLKNKKIAVEVDTIFGNIIQEKISTAKLSYGITTEDTYRLLAEDKVDSILVGNLNEDLLDKYKLKAVSEIYHKSSELYIGVNKKYPTVASILEKAVSSISLQDMATLREKWFKKSDSSLKLTQEEKRWLSSNKIVLSVDDKYAPMNFRNKQNIMDGLSIDYIKLIEKKIAYPIELFTADWPLALNKAMEHKTDGIINANSTPKRDKKLIFTEPYVTVPMLLVTRNNTKDYNSLGELKKKIILVKEKTVEASILPEKYPNIIIKEVKNYQEALKLVSLNKADGVFGHMAVLDHDMNQYMLPNLKNNLVSFDDIVTKQGIGIRKNAPLLLDILNKAIISIGINERQYINDKWMGTSSRKAKEISYSKEEKKWLKNNPIIKIAVMNFWQKDDAGNNIHTDLLKMINKYGNLNIIPIKYDRWKNGFEDASKGSNSYGVMNLSWSKDREKNFFYTKPYNFTPSKLIVRKSNIDINKIEDLNNKIVYLREGTITQKIIEEKTTNVKVINLKNEKIMYKQLGTTKVADAIFDYTLDKELLEKYNLKVVQNIYDKYSEVAIGISKNKPELYSIIKKIYEVIPKSELSYIQNKVYKKTKKIKVKLNSKEQLFIKNNPVIKVHNEKNWPPFNFYEFGKPKGYSVDLMNIVAENTGLNIEYVTGPTWDKFLKMMQENNLDVMINIVKNEKREKYMLFTDPFLKASMGIAVREERKDINNFKDILDKKVSIENGFFYHDYFIKNHPDTKLVVVDDGHQTLQAVEFEQADATIGFVSVMNYIAKKNFISNLRYFSDNKEKLFKPAALSFSVNKSTPELLSILQKGLASVTPEEQDKLSRRWLNNDSSNKKINVNLSLEEKEWLKKQKEIKIGIQRDWVPLSYIDNNNPKGLGVDFLNLFNKNLGDKIKIVPDSFRNNLEKVKNRNLDAMIDITNLEARQEFYYFTSDYANIPHYIVSNKGNKEFYKNIIDLDGKTIAVEEGYGIANRLNESLPNVKIKIYKNTEDSLEAVSLNQVDAYIGNRAVVNYIIKKNFITNLKFHGRSTLSNSDLAIATSKDKKILRDILEKLLQGISLEEKEKMYEKYIGQIAEKKIKLSKKEQAWVDKKEPIRYVYDPDWAPFEWKNELNEHTGIIYDLLTLITERTGIILQPVPTNTWSEAVKLAETKKIDMFGGLGENEDRKKYMKFTKNSLYKTPYVFVVHKDNQNDYFDTFNSLKDNERIAVVNKYTIQGIMKDKRPEVKIMTVSSTMEGFNQVTDKKIEIFLVNAATAKYYINRKGFANLKIATKTQFQLEIKSAIRKDWPPEVISIIDKALDSITDKELADIYHKWTEVIVEKKIDWTLIYNIGGGALLIVIFIAYWNRRLKKAVDSKTTELKKLLLSFDENVIASKTDLKGNIIYVSRAFCEVSGYHENELIGKPQNIVRHPDMPKEIFKDLWTTIQSGKVWRGEVKNLKKEGGYYWVESIIEPIFNESNKAIGYSAIRHDITAKKEVEELSANLELKVKQRTLALNESQERFELTVSGSGNGLWEYNSQTKENWFSPLFKEMLGFTDEELPNTFESWKKHVHTDDIDSAMDSFVEHLQNDDNYDISYRMKRKDEQYIWVRSRAKSIRDKNGRVLRTSGSITDITNLKKAQEEIKESQKRFLTLFDAAPDSIAIIKDGEYIDCNQKTLEIFGVKSINEFKKTKPSDYSPDYQENGESSEKLSVKKITDAIINGYNRFEWIHKRLDTNENFDAEVILSSIELGGKSHIYAVVRDISERKLLEKKIAQNKLFVDTLLDSQEQIVITTDGEKLRSCNKAFLELFDISIMEEFTKDYDCICDRFESDTAGIGLEKMMGNLTWIEYILEYENITHKAIIKKNGIEKIFSVTAATLPIGDGNLRSAVFTDITEIEDIRKNIETILSNIMLPVLITSKEERKILYANEYASKQYESPINELVGSSIDSVYTSSAQQTEILKIIEEEDYVENLEEKYRTKTGKEFIGLLSVKPILYNGEDSYIGMVVDITKQKEIEDEIRQIHKHTRSSIEYASLIQHSLIPSNDLFRKYFDDYFTIWHPKDIVGGDIYLFEELRSKDECLLMVIDCTGHGVPGAFVTMLVKAIERQVSSIIANDPNLNVSPGWILKYFNQTMKKLLKQEDDTAISNAGFDGAVLYYNKKEQIVKFAGAELPLYYMENGEIKIIKGNRHSIGYKKSDANYKFDEHIIEAKKGMKFYLTTDGYLDQNGGTKGFPFGRKRFKTILEDYQNYSFADQQEVLLNELQEYQKDEERNDDITILGIKI